MIITLKVFATLRQKYPNIQTLDVNHESTVADIFNIINLNPETVSIIMVNGISVKIDHVLAENDVMSLFPPVGGG